MQRARTRLPAYARILALNEPLLPLPEGKSIHVAGCSKKIARAWPLARRGMYAAWGLCIRGDQRENDQPREFVRGAWARICMHHLLLPCDRVHRDPRRRMHLKCYVLYFSFGCCICFIWMLQ